MNFRTKITGRDRLVHEWSESHSETILQHGVSQLGNFSIGPCNNTWVHLLAAGVHTHHSHLYHDWAWNVILIFLSYIWQKAELNWVAEWSCERWFTRPKTVTHPGTNHARCTATKLTNTKLPIQGAPKNNNPIGKVQYHWNCSRFSYQIYSIYREGLGPHIL